MTSKPHSRRITTLYFSTQKNCEESLKQLAEDYNKLADEVERLWSLEEQLEAAQRVIDAARLVVEKRAVYVGIPMADGRPSGRVTYPLDDALAAYDASFPASRQEG
jgi:hypothetical protein